MRRSTAFVLTLLAASIARADSTDTFDDASLSSDPFRNNIGNVAVDNRRADVAALPQPAGVILLAVGGVCAIGFRRGLRRISVGLATCLLCGGVVNDARAQFDPQVGQPGSLAIPHTSPLFTEWAATVLSITRGHQDITNSTSPLASFGSPTNALGASNGNSGHVVSLGDGGSITLGFAIPITNGPGDDFAVFENGFLSGATGLAYLELGFVDVSSDGVDFFRFPSISLTQTTTQVGGFSSLDARNLYDLAGKYIGGFGTGFDLSELAGVSPLLDVNHIIAVRVTDVVGSIDPRYGTRDSLGNLINDPFKTPFASGGFDLNGIGVINTAVPEPSTIVVALWGVAVSFAVSYRRRRSEQLA